MTAVPPDRARRVGIVGAGVIGGGWALHYLRAGLDVDVYDPASDARGDLLRMAEDSWPLLERMGPRPGASLDRLTFNNQTDAAVADADVVQENAPEVGAVKRQVLAGIDRAARPGVVIASSTSGFAMTMLQADREHPGRCVVGHPFNPPDPAGRGGGRRAYRSGRRRLAGRLLRQHRQAAAAADPGTAWLRR